MVSVVWLSFRYLSLSDFYRSIGDCLFPLFFFGDKIWDRPLLACLWFTTWFSNDNTPIRDLRKTSSCHTGDDIVHCWYHMLNYSYSFLSTHLQTSKNPTKRVKNLRSWLGLVANTKRFHVLRPQPNLLSHHQCLLCSSFWVSSISSTSIGSIMTISSSLPPRNKPMPCIVLIRSFGLHLNLYLHNTKSAVVMDFLLETIRTNFCKTISWRLFN